MRDAGGGIPPEILPKVNAYAFTTVDGQTSSSDSGDPDVESDHRDDGPYGAQNAGGGVGLDEVSGLQSSSGHLAGLGFGLPLSKLHCEVSTYNLRYKRTTHLYVMLSVLRWFTRARQLVWTRNGCFLSVERRRSCLAYRRTVQPAVE